MPSLLGQKPEQAWQLQETLSDFLGKPETRSQEKGDACVRKETKKILLLEDDEVSAEFIKVLLQRHGYEVFHTRDGSEALKMAKEYQPDLILLDVMLPGLDGYSVHFKLLEDEETKSIPIIMVTVKSEMKDVFATEPNIFGFITKPFRSKELIEKIKSVIP